MEGGRWKVEGAMWKVEGAMWKGKVTTTIPMTTIRTTTTTTALKEPVKSSDSLG